MDLMRRTAVEVGDYFQFPYTYELDRRTVTYQEKVKILEFLSQLLLHTPRCFT